MADSKMAKAKLGEFLAAVSADYEVYGPKADNGVVTFGRIASADELALTYSNSTVSAKELFLPKTETVYEFDGENFVDDPLPEQKRVVLGLRPCDCRALTLLDGTFDCERVQDPFYVTRRANTVLVALACDRPLSSCFCTATGGDPYGEEGVDVLLSDEGESFLAKAVTDRGKDFLEQYGKFFSGKAAGKWAERAKAASGKMTCDLSLAEVSQRLDGLFEDDMWERVSQKCIGCGTCSYLCPTCYCFDLIDDKTATGVKKIRRWDCCMFQSFALHASGHDPRPITAARFRQKIMHKFNYHPQRCGLNSCVGCGRCVRACPVNLDIRQLLGDILAAAPSAASE
ncbi:hypothetical protein LCGC14_0015150 [marine sediment metagenome]|uniref:4Fe-4S ferredoxin-type domain-containing protein n=1 Tax=marine sediment metagenome TaxID=412755 RepID=A0A0F9W3V1_9ZZZZ|nr:4Fe-4S ferredoxin [Phycisphaerae bacterium]HDZ43870.1 4Fe-4S ferredoxin [Phycisphaerae bacterium]